MAHITFIQGRCWFGYHIVIIVLLALLAKLFAMVSCIVFAKYVSVMDGAFQPIQPDLSFGYVDLCDVFFIVLTARYLLSVGVTVKGGIFFVARIFKIF